ncbi:MAG: cysteine peptidase family C39 domain-containing protein [Isosphaeraceae bacterium]
MTAGQPGLLFSRLARTMRGRMVWVVVLLCGLVVLSRAWLARNRVPAQRVALFAGDPRASCGPVSLALAAQWCRCPAAIDRLNELTHAGESGTTSLLDLRQAALAVGLQAQAVRLDASRPLPWKLPMILHMHGNHFVAALPIDGERLVLADLPNEPRVWDKRKLTGDWQGVALLVARSKPELDTALHRGGFL